MPHCDSGVLEAGMPIHSVALCSYGQAAFANPNQTSILGSGGNLQLPRAKKKLIELSFKIRSHLLAWSGPIDLRFEQGLLEVCTYEKPACQSFAT